MSFPSVPRRALVGLPGLAATAARAEPLEEVRETYRRFVAAQNARDIPAVRSFLLDSPDYLWISDGRAYWGPDAMLARFGGFQALEIWQARPGFAAMRAVAVSEDVAFLHFPLELVVGAREAPNHYHFLIDALFRRTALGWRIAALFTTDAKPN
jgi:ketosteroid isomerase-like protein